MTPGPMVTVLAAKVPRLHGEPLDRRAVRGEESALPPPPRAYVRFRPHKASMASEISISCVKLISFAPARRSFSLATTFLEKDCHCSGDRG